MYNVLFTVGSEREIVHAEQFAVFEFIAKTAARLEKQFGVHIITLGANSEKFKLAEKHLAGRTMEDDDRMMAAAHMGEVPVECSRCGSTGTYHWGAVVNGVPSRSGKCFDCAGKGKMDRADVKRDSYYHDHVSIPQ